jgi:DNA-binding response OmpR family regulator
LGPMAAATTSSFPSRVLIVDDEVTTVDVLTVVLKKHKLASSSAMNGEDAIALLQKERFGCLLVDKNLPGKSGLDVIREAKRLQPYCACLMMTGYPTTDSVLEALRLGATDYLEKPFPELGLVLQRVQAAMDNSRTAFEREALATTLREMKARLKQSEEAVFQRQTELDVFVQVLELRVDEATAPLAVEVAKLRDKVLALATRTGKAAESVKAQASRATMALQRPKGTLEDAREALESLARALDEIAGELQS